ncbi:uncharacterized protein LOC125506922 [Triticum urartu]|uniref:uncharacterized protein LOC125506922 n=1 Tax=Triticum urartu TaxID=4572 RepID=UPI0020440934|nr:uncharacterized protein LOC125506922 [Triticum urartu]
MVHSFGDVDLGGGLPRPLGGRDKVPTAPPPTFILSCEAGSGSPVSLLPPQSGRLNHAPRSRRRGFPHQSGATLPSHPERQPRGIGGATRCQPRRWCRSATCRTRRCGTTWSRTPSSGSSSVAWAASVRPSAAPSSPSASASPCPSSPATLFFILRDAFQQCFIKFFTLVKGFCNLYTKEKGLEKMTDLKNRFSHLLNHIAKKNRWCMAHADCEVKNWASTR